MCGLHYVMYTGTCRPPTKAQLTSAESTDLDPFIQVKLGGQHHTCIYLKCFKMVCLALNYYLFSKDNFPILFEFFLYLEAVWELIFSKSQNMATPIQPPQKQTVRLTETLVLSLEKLDRTLKRLTKYSTVISCRKLQNLNLSLGPVFFFAGDRNKGRPWITGWVGTISGRRIYLSATRCKQIRYQSPGLHTRQMFIHKTPLRATGVKDCVYWTGCRGVKESS